MKDLEKVVPVIFLAVIIILSGFLDRHSPEPQDLEVVAQLQSIDKSTWQLQGRVLRNGQPVENAYVSATLDTTGYNRGTPAPVKTNKDGFFSIAKLPKEIGQSAVKDVQIRAIYNPVPEDKNSGSLKGSSMLDLSVTEKKPQLHFPLSLYYTLCATFFAGIILPFLGVPSQVNHLFGIALALVFTVLMITLFVGEMNFIYDKGEQDKTMSFGAGYIVFGRYLSDQEPEWIFSLTDVSRRSDEKTQLSKNHRDTISGFGAPLWVMLIAVMGSGFLTLSLVLAEIGRKSNFDDLASSDATKKAEAVAKIYASQESLLKHQFFVLFAPIGAIFIYQLLVLSKATNEPITVAIATLGAGAALNSLLNKAVTFAKTLIEHHK